MQKIFDEVMSLDKRCYEEFALSEDILMEHASEHLAQVIKTKTKPKSKIFFLCGPGNNGGDGIASARILHKEFEVQVYLPYGVKSKMARLQLKRYKLIGGQIVDEVSEANVYIDAMFGSGLRGKLDEKSCKIIYEINQKDAIKISCDIPSGIGADFISSDNFKADISVSMGALKLPFFEDMAKDYVGNIEVANLGVAREVYENDSDIYLLEIKDMKLPFRNKKNTNKGAFGHTCIVQGKKRGAAVLAGISALNFGCGLVSLLSDNDNQIPPYLMVTNKIPDNCTSLVVGMGLGKNDFDFDLLQRDCYPIVIDADLFYNKKIKTLLQSKQDIVLTPHPKEFASLLEICEIAKVTVKEIQSNRFKHVRAFMELFPSITLILKGANTIITKDKKIYVSTLGTSSLSKGGSGDVLSGMIGSLLAQGYQTRDAAITAVLAHSMASKEIKLNSYALNPMDICEGIKYL
ncbi:MAG: NAD(P)H-hydrate dehydratase [Epsilonproteobacteria bacterium]|nr:NAD(P)H-hydrate dehydratase [Campylobacterota bacterium]